MLPVRDQQTTLEEFQSLPPIAPGELIGLWKGHGIATGHPFDGVLENLGWFGKRFRPDMRADALLFRSGDLRLVAVDPKWIPLRFGIAFSRGRQNVRRAQPVFLFPPPAAGEGSDRVLEDDGVWRRRERGHGL